MGKPANTNSITTFNPMELHANLLKTFSLLQKFSSRLTSEHSEVKSGANNNAFTRATTTWATHLATQPMPVMQAGIRYLTEQTQLWQRTSARLWGFDIPLSHAPINDRRFKDPAWGEYPMGEFLMHSYLNFANYWRSLLDIDLGLPPKEAEKARFFLNSMVDALAPNNFAATNPQVWQLIRETNGANLVRGMENLLEDFQDGELRIRMTDTQSFEVGRDIATTPGQVIFRNHLFELIQYTPSTEKVNQRPLLIVPPWINKYYILDLREKNSLVKWAVEQGNTVFIISWVNPDSELKNVNFDDYLADGTLAAMDAVCKATGEAELNIASYCLGGTLTAATLAYLTAKKDKRIKSATFFTTLIDFSDPGEIGVFLDEEQVTSLEALMEKNGGYLDGKNMGASFNMLRANDLIWSFFVNLYLLGKDPMPFDLLYWNSDSTRMPAAMHSFYLRNMYLKNCFREPGGIRLLDTPIDISQIKTPVYFVSAYDDHIAPWRTTYQGFKLFSGPKRFVLGQSGHIAGIVNPAAANKYGHWVNENIVEDANEWLDKAQKVDLSWWHDWDKWLGEFKGDSVDAREPGAGELKALCAAPGTYVLK